ncbi:MAG: tRNA (adenosine(37)-N6)-threonylcarbamoyltransferase complex dimerization subunit type 1 TsaB [Lentisphaeria bacterium]|nr:tRNA (adenosine(37)-N6)-threonylcarbamoyltransferase complex dimerization subunit type 1 TsaB [Lentisphaeria bacterium]
MYRAGFDYSRQEASFAVADRDGKILLEKFREFPPRNASGLPGWLEECLTEVGLTFNDISEWSVGNGPGSFTGLRVAASFVMGLAFGKNIRTRGVSTAGAIADSLELPESVTRVMTLFDGHRDELLAFGLERKDGSFVPSGVHLVLNRESLDQISDYDVLATMAKDHDKVAAVGGELILPRLRSVEHIAASRLIFNDEQNFSTPLTDPVYLRPAVFVEPKIPRQFPEK